MKSREAPEAHKKSLEDINTALSKATEHLSEDNPEKLLSKLMQMPDKEKKSLFKNSMHLSYTEKLETPKIPDLNLGGGDQEVPLSAFNHTDKIGDQPKKSKKTGEWAREQMNKQLNERIFRK